MKLSGRNVGVAGCLAVLAACGGDLPTQPLKGEPMELAAARALWDAQGVDDYRMTVRLTGPWANGTAVILVRDGVPVVVHQVGRYQGAALMSFSEHDTVEELFAMLGRDADRVIAEFHPHLGLPVEGFLDVHAGMIDDESGFIVESFERR
jgi:hypothetical protein